MKRKINPKYQYLLLPLTYVFICVVAAFNYLLMKRVKKAIHTIILGVLSSAIFFLIIPQIVSMLVKSNMLEEKIFLPYFYFVSTIIGVYIIREQQIYIRNLDYNI